MSCDDEIQVQGRLCSPSLHFADLLNMKKIRSQSVHPIVFIALVK